MIHPISSNFLSFTQYFRDSKKENLINTFNEISNETIAVTKTDYLNRTLNQVTKIDDDYQAYLKLHNCVMRFIINLCWWKSSAHGAFVACRRSLIRRVAAGYEDKMITLLTCKHFLKSESHRLFCADALEQAITNTYQKKEITGFVWKVINTKGVTNYLIGTIHQGTTAMGKVKGVVEAIRSSEKFFTEKGLLSGWYRCAHFPLMTKDWRFLFIIDRHIALEARRKNKPNFALDNHLLENEACKVAEEVQKQNPEQTVEIELTKEGPAKEYFITPTLNIDGSHPLNAELGKVFLP